KKGEELRKEKGEKKPSVVRIAEDISSYVDETEGFSLGDKSFRNYFKEAKRLKDSEKDISIKQLQVITGLCRYLGYAGYEDFVAKMGIKEKEEDNGGGFPIATEESYGKNRNLNVLIKKNKILI